MSNSLDLAGGDVPDAEEQQLRIAQVLSTMESLCAPDASAEAQDDTRVQPSTESFDEEDLSQWAVLETPPLVRMSSLSSEGSLTENGVMPTSRVRAEQAIATTLRPVTAEEAEQMLKRKGWDIQRAVVELTDVQEEEARLLARRVLPPTITAPDDYQGMENVGNTCYLDSVLMAMFGTMTTFDSLLTRDVDDPQVRGLQHELLTVVNRVRNGRLVTKEQMKRLLNLLHTMDWPPGDLNSYGQQDASELFITLLDRLGGPLLPMAHRMVHGAMAASGDDKLVKESILQVSVVPEGDSASNSRSTTLLDVLKYHYFGEDIVDVERDVECDKMGDPIKRKRVKALRTLHSLPFYDSHSVCGKQQQPLQTQNIIIPICFKRYRHVGGLAQRVDRRVEIPTSLDFSQFVSTESQPPRSYTLDLMSLVCHKGHQINSGHYRAYIRTLDDEWLLFDDLGTPRVKRLSLLESTVAMTEEWQCDAYIALFALNHKPIASQDEPNDVATDDEEKEENTGGYSQCEIS